MSTHANGYTVSTYTVDPIDIAEVPSFVKHLIKEFAKYDLNGEFRLPKGYEGGEVIFTDPKQQFLYELHGGFNLYKRLREQYLHWQEEEIARVMAEEISKEIDKMVIQDLIKEADLNNARLNDIP